MYIGAGRDVQSRLGVSMLVGNGWLQYRDSLSEIEANFAGFPRKWNSSCDMTAEMKTRCTVMLLY